nr:MdtA/MuxA family multidrug efflux RND transporter periplasmic adaptor subunit [Variovorax terrae]
MGHSELPARHALTRRRWLVIGACALAIGASASLWLWRGAAKEANLPGPALAGSAPAAGTGGRRFTAENRVQPVTVGTVQRRDMRAIHAAIGNIAALNTAVIRARVDGELRAIHFKEGQQVRAGQLLAELDPRAFEVQLAQAQGQLARDQALFRNAQLDLDRYKDLSSRDSIARQQVDTQEALVRQLQGTLQVDQAAVDNARLMLSYTRITAPISGQLGLKLADLGNLVRANDATGIVTITQTQPISVVFAVPEALLPRLTAKLRASDAPVVEAWDREQRNRLAQGKISTTDNAIDPVTGTIKLKAEFANAQGVLFPNQFVNIRLQLDTQADALAIPVTALQRGARGSFVYVVKDDGTVTIRGVRPGAVDGEWVSVQGELAAGDKVVTDGADRLREGAKAEVIKPPPRPASAASPRAAEETTGAHRAASAPSTSASAPAPKAKGGSSHAAPSAQPAASAPPRPAAAGAASGGAATAERPAWLDRLPPEVQERFMKMTPEERRAFIEKLRERRRQMESGGG